MALDTIRRPRRLGARPGALSSELSRRYPGKREWFEVAFRNIVEMHRQAGDLVPDDRRLARRGLIVRHLAMPGALTKTEAMLHFVG